MFPKQASLHVKNYFTFNPGGSRPRALLETNTVNSYKQSLYIGLVRIFANLIMVAAIFLAMYQAARWPGWSSETVFCLFFFGITIPVWTVAWLSAKWIRKRWPAINQSMVQLPGLGKQLVSWQALEPKNRNLVIYASQYRH